jgi:hypothetical protein
MSGKIYAKASRNIRLRSSGLFRDNQSLEDTLLVAIIHQVYVLYSRETCIYHLISLDADNTYEKLLILDEHKKLTLDELVHKVETLKEIHENGCY